MIELAVVRHGQSTWNASGRWQGRADPPLSPLGRHQARAAAAAVAARSAESLDVPIVAVWSSPLERAAATARVLARALAVPLELDARLVERDAGEWTGLTRAEIEAGWPGHLAAGRRPPGFEADEVLAVRATAVLHDVADRADGHRVLVVSHGGLIRSVERALGIDAPPVPNLGGRALHRPGDRAGGLVAGDRFLLVDPETVEVTTPRQL